MNNAVKNQIYRKKSQYMSLDRLFGIAVRSNSLIVTKTPATIVRHEKCTDMQKNFQACIITAYFHSF